MSDDLRLRADDPCPACGAGLLLRTTTIGATGSNPDLPPEGASGLRCETCSVAWVDIIGRPGWVTPDIADD